MRDTEINLETLKEDIRAFRNFKGSSALAEVLRHAQQLDEILFYHDGSVRKSELISAQYGFWQNFSSAMITAQMEYIGPDQERGLNKAYHSLEVGEGVAMGYQVLNPDVSIEELNYICFRGHLHDGGRILNLSPSVLNDNSIEALGYRSPVEICMEASRRIVSMYPELGSAEEVSEAICYAAIANRQSGLFELAKELNPQVAVVGEYFYRKNVHNPIYLSGLHNFTAHHNKPNAPLNDPENYNGRDEYTVIDHLSKVIDMASASTGSADYLDEIALYLLAKTEKGECEPSYTRLVLEGYGEGNSILERWSARCKGKGFYRVPEGKPDYMNFEDFKRALDDKEFGQVEFPRFFGQWSSHPSDKEREALKTHLKEFRSLHQFINQQTLKLPKLKVNDASTVKVTVANLII